MYAWALLLFAIITPRSNLISDSTTVVEVNHVYDDGDGCLVFDQIIWWDWHGWPLGYAVRDWRMIKGEVRGKRMPDPVNEPHAPWTAHSRWIGGDHAMPRYNHERELWVSTWYDERSHCWREVTALIRRETWTWHDPEVDHRGVIPEGMRGKLTKPNKLLDRG